MAELTQIFGFPNAQGQTDLILAGDQLYHMPIADMLQARPQGPRLLSDHPGFTAPIKLAVPATDAGDVAVFALSKTNSITHMYLFESYSVVTDSEPTVVLPEGQGGDFAAIEPQSVVVRDALNNLQLYTIDPYSSTWMAGQVFWT